MAYLQQTFQLDQNDYEFCNRFLANRGKHQHLDIRNPVYAYRCIFGNPNMGSNEKVAKIAFWESFRILIILLIIITLFNPERLEKLDREQKSQIVCLQDVSDSMQTEESLLTKGNPSKDQHGHKNSSRRMD